MSSPATSPEQSLGLRKMSTYAGGMLPAGGGKCCLAVWENGHINQNLVLVELRLSVTALAFGVWEGRAQEEFCVLGLADGSLLISSLPFPLVTITSTASVNGLPSGAGITGAGGGGGAGGVVETLAPSSLAVPFSRMKRKQSTYTMSIKETDDSTVDSSKATNAGTETRAIIDENLCRVLAIHVGPVSKVCVSQNSLWIISGGYDGTMSIVSTGVITGDADVSEHPAEENNIILTNRLELMTQKQRAEEDEAHVEELLREKDRVINQIKESSKQALLESEATRKREVGKRDQIIITERDDHVNRKKAMDAAVEGLRESHERDLAALEVEYERRLAQETLYLQKIRQAYDEHVSHAKHDMLDAKKKTEAHESQLKAEKLSVMAETDKQREVILQYCDYVAQRYQEVMASLENAHDEER